MWIQRRLARSERVMGCLALAVALSTATLLSGQAAPEVAAVDEHQDLRSEVQDTFRVLILSDGLLLEPKDGAGGILELSGGAILRNGEAMALADLERELGGSAELIRRLAGLDSNAQRALFRRPSAPNQPDPPVVHLQEAEEAVESRVGDRERPRRPPRRRRTDAQVSVGSSLTVEEDEIARDVVVVGGSLKVKGEVIGDAVAIGGSVWVDGKVAGDVVCVGGVIHLQEGAEVLGELVSVGGTLERHPSAIVGGGVTRVAIPGLSNLGHWLSLGLGSGDHWGRDVGLHFSPIRRFMRLVWEVVGWTVVALLACAVLLLLRGPVERVEGKIRAEPWKAGLAGFAFQVLCLPLFILLVLILAISIIGIPILLLLLLLLPFALVALIVGCFMGFSATALRVGSWSQERFGWRLESPYVVLIIGMALISAPALLSYLLDIGGGPLRWLAALFLFLGCLVQYVVLTVGLGGLLLTRFGTVGGTPDWGGAAYPPPAPEPRHPEDERVLEEDYAADSLDSFEIDRGEDGEGQSDS